MEPDAVAQSYDKIAHVWNSEQFDRTNGVAAHKRALQFIEDSGCALDVGCGCSGRIIDLLQDNGFVTEGLDISPQMLKLARERHPEVTFHEADICTWQSPQHWDFISAWDSIWHIPLHQHPNVLGKLINSLNPGGVLIFTTGGLNQPDEVHNQAMGPPMYHSTPGLPDTLAIIHEHNGICRHLEYDQYPEPHVYIIVQRPR